ncbi:Poly(glycerol-phosphate) alpha-glucosyltransferase [Microbacterium lemovicicum]|uniref:Poly(Glycerol-phosphate) alpha-glucosyltransferase n=1 Tax=Microbacterium lemovicicum TaxID=1072463 RepID=A0A3S9W7L6_9MICO|nr:glycosyltransferase [Microbacterium lemovicicum]AZS35953.1 Poly(glycerol-phosphate) alpha-glucosyltransferase [Microbacterium lemovicicum]
MVEGFPDAVYVVLSSRLIPDHDGGYTFATLARARQMAAAGVDDGRGPLLLTVDPGTPDDHERHRRTFAARDLITGVDRMRNLFDEAADPAGGAAAWLRAAAHPGGADPALEYRRIPDAAGRPVLSLPVIAGNPDWHVSTAPVVLHDATGRPVGAMDGFGALYRAWLDHVLAELRVGDPSREVVVLCESRQLGELLAGWEDPGARVLHTVHTIHLEPPFTPEAPVNALWSRWLGVADRFDAVLWPTSAQRDDVAGRFGGSGVHLVVPQGVDAAASVVPPTHRVPGRVVMLNRLAPGKRIDHAVRAFARVRDRVPEASLEVFGEGAERDRLQSLVDDLALGDAVHLRGTTHQPDRELGEAMVFLSTSAYEGQGLSIAEALAHGCPVVTYDVRYGPREALSRGGGVLVPDGDEDALADALVRVLTDPGEHARLAAEAVDSARRLDPALVMGALAEAVRTALSAPPRRG